jgi:hypothetical protein
MMAGEILSQAMVLLKPVFGEHTVASRGTILVGMVEGDLHDIGKNIVSALLETEGFTIVDIGVFSCKGSSLPESISGNTLPPLNKGYTFPGPKRPRIGNPELPFSGSTGNDVHAHGTNRS